MTQDFVIEISRAAIDVAAAVRLTASPAVGAIDIFLGVTRFELREDGVALCALDYEAFDTMAIEQLQHLLTDARTRWPIARATILHRVGRVAVGEASVLIAVSCPHRAQAFDACRFLIDELKKSVTIWKREVWADESTSWVAGTLPTTP